MTTSDAPLDETKQLKVAIPVAIHLKLHAYRLLDGKTLSTMVEEALDRYLDQELEDAGVDPEGLLQAEEANRA